jgi:hypothetical protein
MDKNTLRKLIEAEIKSALNEEIIEPSEQVLKGVQKELKLKTGIIAMLGLEKKSPAALYYTMDLSREIKTPVLQALFSTLTLDVTCRPIPQSIGGYSFDLSINYKHPQGGSNGKNLGTIFFMNGKFTSRIL